MYYGEFENRELGKQNIQAEEVYYSERSEPRENARETRDFSRLPKMVWKTAHLPKFGYPSLKVFFIAFRFVAMKISLFPSQGLP